MQPQPHKPKAWHWVEGNLGLALRLQQGPGHVWSQNRHQLSPYCGPGHALPLPRLGGGPELVGSACQAPELPHRGPLTLGHRAAERCQR